MKDYGYAGVPLSAVRAVTRDVLLGLRFLHEEEPLPGCRVLHRDLKPDNIGFRASSGVLVLLDFGLAHRWQHDGGNAPPATSSTSSALPSTPTPMATHSPTGAAADEARLLTGQMGSTR